MIRFHLDEHVDPAVAHGLRLRGIDVTTTVDAGLSGAADPDHLAFAAREGRVVVTQDDDFLKLGAQSNVHAGIAFWPPNTRSIGEIVGYLELMDACLSTDEMHGRVEYF